MKRHSRARRVLGAVILATALAIFLFPVVWMFLTSFKNEAEFFSYPPVFIPKSFSLVNYLNAMRFPPDGRGGLQGVRDSLIVSSGSMAVSLLLGAPAAYSFARYRTGGPNLSFWVLSTRMFPPSLVPVVSLAPSTGHPLGIDHRQHGVQPPVRHLAAEGFL